MAVFAYKYGIRSYHIHPIMEEVGERYKLSVKFYGEKKMFEDFRSNSPHSCLDKT